MLKNEEGQAIFEFILFLPLLLVLYSVLVTIDGALNASINQQKTARSYFYYLRQNDSRFPSPDRFSGDALGAFSLFSMTIIGWADKFDGNVPIAACYRFNIPLADAQDDECETAYSGDVTQFIRVGTVYGVCGANYVREGTRVGIAPFAQTGNSPLIVTDPRLGCALVR